MIAKRHALRHAPRRAEDFTAWYAAVLHASETLDSSPVPGCHVLRPWGTAMWRLFQRAIDERVSHTRVRGAVVREAVFPTLIPAEDMRLETEHFAGFAPEVAWVTHFGPLPTADRGHAVKGSGAQTPMCSDAKDVEDQNASGNTHQNTAFGRDPRQIGDADQAGTRGVYAIRPTSEALVCRSLQRWVRTQRDLPIRLAQWCSVMRWERRTPLPLVRPREFLWQEGHCAFADAEGAKDDVAQALGAYAHVLRETLCVPVVAGLKSPGETFAGATWTATLETAFGDARRALQMATAHFLGTAFARVYGVSADGQPVWQTSWGVTVRALGAAVMAHGDDAGLVLPPGIAPVQVVLLPAGDDVRARERCVELEDALGAGGVRARADVRDDRTYGWKANTWELRGVPLLVTVGAREAAEPGALRLPYAVRSTGVRGVLVLPRLADGRVDGGAAQEAVRAVLAEISSGMRVRAQERFEASVRDVRDLAGLVGALEDAAVARGPWCGRGVCEDKLRTASVGDSRAASVGDSRAASVGGAHEASMGEARAASTGGARAASTGGARGRIKVLCVPVDERTLERVAVCEAPCVVCASPSVHTALFGRTF